MGGGPGLTCSGLGASMPGSVSHLAAPSPVGLPQPFTPLRSRPLPAARRPCALDVAVQGGRPRHGGRGAAPPLFQAAALTVPRRGGTGVPAQCASRCSVCRRLCSPGRDQEDQLMLPSGPHPNFPHSLPRLDPAPLLHRLFLDPRRPHCAPQGCQLPFFRASVATHQPPRQTDRPAPPCRAAC